MLKEQEVAKSLVVIRTLRIYVVYVSLVNTGKHRF